MIGGESVETREVSIEWEGKQVTVVLKKMKWGDKADMLNYAIGKMKVLGGEIPQMEIDVAKFKEGLVKYSISSAPFEVTAENLRKIDGKDFDELFKVAQELNPFRNLF
jgi:hypothetical protein